MVLLRGVGFCCRCCCVVRAPFTPVRGILRAGRHGFGGLWQDKSSDSNRRIGNEEKTLPCIPFNYESRLIFAMINAMSATNEEEKETVAFRSIENRAFRSCNEFLILSQLLFNDILFAIRLLFFFFNFE